MFEVDYSDKFGFTEMETKEFIDRHPVCHSPDAIKKWYNSYSAGSNLLLYNPWSIVSVCRGNSLKSYWVETGIFASFMNFSFTNLLPLSRKYFID